MKKFGDERERYLARHREALIQGREGDAKHIEGKLRVLDASRMDELRKARVGGLDPGVPVVYPGRYEEWVACNFEDPVEWSVVWRVLRYRNVI